MSALVFTDDGLHGHQLYTLHRFGCSETAEAATYPVGWPERIQVAQARRLMAQIDMTGCLVCNPIGLLRDRERRAA